MSNFKGDDDFLTAPIDDYLLSIADSLQRVQRQLNQSQVLSLDGHSFLSYQLPKLEFELKMSISMDSVTHQGQQRSIIRAAPINAKRTSSKSQSTEAASTLKGIFVAVPSDRGKPPPVIRSFIREINHREYEISILVQSAVGEFLPGIEVQFNIDKELSASWSALDDLTGELHEDTFFWYGVRATNENGIASDTLQISEHEVQDTTIAVIVDVLGKTETIVFKVTLPQVTDS